MSDGLEPKTSEEVTVTQLCPYCKKTIGEEDNLKVCPVCGVHHHLECWNQNDGCSTFKCRGDKPEKKIICKKCGTELEDNQRFCPNCGVSITQMNENVCDNCGSKMSKSQSYCPVCGKRKTVGEIISASDSSIEVPTQLVKSGEKKDYSAIIVTVVIFAIVGVVLFFIIKGCVSTGKSDLFIVNE